MDKFLDALYSFAEPDRVLLNQPMAQYTTFRIGGPADVMFFPNSTQEILVARALAEESGAPVTVIGCGSNLLVSDDGIAGLVIALGRPFSRIEVRGTQIWAQAGARLSSVASAALEHGLTGLEFASGIPGSVGGGVYMNAGAYGGQLSDVLESVELLYDGMAERVPASEMGFSYRHSAAMDAGALVTGALFQLHPGDPAEIRARMDELNRRRREKQPLEYPSAGSTFKRPEGHFAGTLIEQAGLKGLRVGGAMVSEKHAGFIVNAGCASSGDVYELIVRVQRAVQDRFGVWLEPEVRFI